MKKIIIFMMLALVPTFMWAQDRDEEGDSIRSNTKYGELFLQKGIFYKFEDFKIEKYPYIVNINGPKIKTSIRKVYNEPQNHYFVKLRADGYVVFIDYSDLVEINKAINKLKSEAENDLLKKPEYLENEYISDDNFLIGYWVKKSLGQYVVKWCFVFDRSNIYGGKFKDIDIDKISKMFQEKQAEIEEMMAADK